MLSLRAAVRSVPRNVARFATSRPATARLAQQSAHGLRSHQPSLWSSSMLSSISRRALSTSMNRQAAAGETDEELSAKLESEIQFENEVKESEALPASIKDFLENGPFDIVDIPGQEEVTLTRTFGNEKITVSFSIADLANPEEYDEDAALSEDGMDSDVPGAVGDTSSSASLDKDLVDDSAEEDMPEGSDAEAAIPCRLSIVVEKPGTAGALSIEATAQDGTIMVQNLYYFADAAMAHGKNAESAHAAQDVYPGPLFGSLDEDLQILMERYLEERGITQALANFVPDYMDAKEQREYTAWLSNLKAFVDA